MSVHYVSVDRLTEFLTALTGKYSANNSESDSKWAVNFAQHAVMDGSNNNIVSTYATKTELQSVDGAAVKSISFTGAGESSATPLTPTNGVVTLDLSTYALKSEVTAALHFKGVVATESALPAGSNWSDGHGSDLPTGEIIGNVYVVEADNSEYVLIDVGTSSAHDYKWEKLGPVIDLTGYATKVSGATANDIAALDGNGNLISTGVSKSVLTGGQVTKTGDGANSFVTGATVATAIENALGGEVVHDVKIQIGSGTAESILDANNVATIAVDSAPTSDSTNLVTSGGVYTAIDNLSSVYSKVVEDDGTTQIATLQEATAAEITALFS